MLLVSCLKDNSTFILYVALVLLFQHFLEPLRSPVCRTLQSDSVQNKAEVSQNMEQRVGSCKWHPQEESVLLSGLNVHQRMFLPDYSDLTTLLYGLFACLESKWGMKIMKRGGWNKGQLFINHRTPLVTVILNTCQNVRCENYHNPLPLY